MSAKPRVTHRTDTRGTVNAEFHGLYEINALKTASEAGIPSELLDPAGWNGDENDIRGFYAEQIYRLGEIPFTAPDCVERLSEIIAVMLQVCRKFGADPRAAIPYSMAGFKRQLSDGREAHAARLRGEIPPVAPHESITWPPPWRAA